MAADNPLPNIPALTAPIEDHVIMDYMGGAFPTKPDTQLKCLQSTVIAAAAPILNLRAALEEQEVTTAQGGLIPVEVVLECFQKTLVLLGNASNYMSLNHRDIIIRKISQKSKGLGWFMNSVYKESKPEGTQLFGTAVQKLLLRGQKLCQHCQKLLLKQTLVVIVRSFFKGAQPVGTAVDRARMSDHTTKATRTLSSRIKVSNNILVPLTPQTRFSNQIASNTVISIWTPN